MVYEGEECGTLIFAGGGAGGMVTASAMVGDLLDWVIGFPGTCLCTEFWGVGSGQ